MNAQEIFVQFLKDYYANVWQGEFPELDFDQAFVDQLAQDVAAEVFADVSDALNSYLEGAMNDYLGESAEATNEGAIEEVFNINQAFKKVIRGGKLVKITKHAKKRLNAKQKMALRKARAKSHTATAMRNRMKSLKIRARKLGEAYVNAGVSCIVNEAFDLEISGADNFEMKPGYMVSFLDTAEEGVISMSIFDEGGDMIKEDVMVDTEFVSTCFSEKLLDSLQEYGILLDLGMSDVEDEPSDRKVLSNISGKEETPAATEPNASESTEPETPATETATETATESGMKLGFTNESGYYVVKDGKKYPMGSRVRARAYLVNEGIDVDGFCFEDARKGEITL